MADDGATDPLANLPRPAGPGRRRLTATDRDYAAWVLSAHYAQGATIRALAEASGYSFGRVRGLLVEAGVRLRRRGVQPGPAG